MGLQAAPGNGRVTLTWDDPGKDVYIASYRYTTDGGETWTEIPDSRSTVQGQLTRYTVPNLTNGQAFTFAVLAENAIGTSPPSATVTATPEGAPPAKPTGLSAAPGNAEATLTWDNPSDASITKYQVKQDATNWADISGSDADTTSHTVGTLTNGTAYTFQIRAVNDHNSDNTDDPGPASDAVTVTPGLPTAPASLSVAPGDAQATLTWTAPASDGGSAVTGYEYTSNADAATPAWTDVPDSGSDGRADETEYTVTSLVNNTTYAFAVRAENDNGQGPATPTLRATPVPPGTPQRPGGLRANPGHQQVRLTWSARLNPNHPVTSYQYRQSTDGGTTWTLWTEIDDSDATTTEHLLTGLTNDTTYTFELRALKDSTAGPSARAQATPSRTAADEVIDRGSSGQLTSPTGGTYTVTQISPPAGLNWRIAVPGTTEIDDRTFTVRSLQGGTPETSPRYTFTSTGQEGLDIRVHPPLAGGAQVCLEPTQLLGQEAGSRPLLVLRYSGTSWTPLPTTTDGGMVCGTTSAFSAFVLGYEVAAPQGGAPAKPTGLSAAPGNAEVTLTWDNPGDASITKYLVKQDAAAWAEISGSDAGTTSHTVGGLSNGTPYTFQIRAVNDHNGDDTDDPGPASDAVTVTPGVPATPASLTAAAGDTQVTLTWTAPANNNGSVVTGYEYTSTADAATPDWTDVPDSGSDGRADETEYTVTGLVNNDTYAFAVRAENANGQGVATPTLRATPVHPDAPQRPAGLRATPGHQQVRLTWSRPNPNHPVTSYQYRQSTDGGTTWNPDWTAVTGSGAATAEHLLTDLANGTTYTFELRALNGSTEGPSARAQATPSDAGAEINRESSGQLTTRTGDTYTVTQLSPPTGLNWRITVPDATDINGRTFTLRSLQYGTPVTSPRYTFTSTGQEGLDIQVQPPPAGQVQVCLEPTSRLRDEAGSRPLLVLRYSGTGWTALPTTTDGGMVCGTTSAFSAFVLGYEVARPGRRDPPSGTNAAPEVAQSLPTRTMRAGETSEPLDLTLYFDDPDDDTLTFAAESDDAGVVIADLPRGSNRLTLRGVAAGEAVVVVTARDPGGERASQSMTVTVRTVAAPEAAQSLPPQTLLVGETSEPLDLTPYFDDPDGDPLTYAAVSYDDAVLVAEVAEGGSQLTLRAVAVGEAVVVVTARDPDGAETILPMTVTVRTNAAPEAARPLPTQTLLVGETSEPLDLTRYFHDPDGDPLTFAAVWGSDASVAIAEVAEGGSQLTLRGVGAGEARILVAARDPDGEKARQSLTVTVRTNAAPEVAQPIPTRTMLVDTTSEPLDLTPYFHDPDGDPLTYAAVSYDDAVLVAEVAEGGSQLTLRAVAAGEAVVIVTARDPFDAEAGQSLALTVRTNAAPEAAQPLPTQTVLVDTTSEPLDLAPYFHDPDGDPLTFAAVSDDDAVLVAELAAGGSELTLRGVAAGEAVVVVTARDPFDAEASQPMTLTVRTNAAPEVAQPLPTQTMLAGTASEPLDLTPYFHDPDGDPLTYAAVSDNAGVAVAELAEGGNELTLRAVAAGEAVVVVTARDPFDAEASQPLTLTVRTNAAPETAQPLPTQTVLAGTASEPLDLTPYFHDPDGDPLTYAAVSANAAVATAGVAGDLFTLTGVAAGTVVVTVTARDPHDGEATQTVIVTVTAVHADWVKAWAARFGRTVTGHVLDGVQERLRVAPRPGFQATLGGHQLGGISEEAARELGDWQLGGSAAFQRELELLAGLTDDEQMSDGAPQQASTARDLFTSSAFSLTVGNAEEGSSGFGALWGRGAVSRFDGREGPLSLTGEVATGMVGIDWISRRWRSGLALAMSRGIGGYSAGVNSGEIESKLTGLFPWVGYDVTDRVSVWATAGYGAGVLTFTPDSAEAMTAELAMSMVAAGARSELLKLRQLGGVMLALETDTRLTRTTTGAIAGLEATEASVWQRRLGLEGSRPVALGGRLSLRPSVEVGLRYDGGDAETGAGMDVGAGLGFSDSGTGLAVDVHVRTLLVHEAEGFSERGVAFSVSYDPTPSTPLGVTARVAPSWGGQAQSGAAALWGRETMVGMAPGGAAQGYRLNGEVGYGLPVAGRFVGTPRVGFARSEHSRDYRVGYGLGVLETGSLHVEVGVDALRSESPLAGGASNALRGQASLGW